MIEFKWLKSISYEDALTLQENTRNTLLEDTQIHGTVFFLEHPPTLTLGRGESGDSLHFSKEWYQEKGFEVFESNRGGKLTYHGPGQLVVYPVINLRHFKLGVKEYVFRLEEVMIQLCQTFGLEANRKPDFPGAWIDQKKIGSIGVHIRKHVSIHGFALNIHTDLSHFTYITPCGLQGVQVTSILNETTIKHSIESLTPKLQGIFSSVFKP